MPRRKKRSNITCQPPIIGFRKQGSTSSGHSLAIIREVPEVSTKVMAELSKISCACYENSYENQLKFVSKFIEDQKKIIQKAGSDGVALSAIKLQEEYIHARDDGKEMTRREITFAMQKLNEDPNIIMDTQIINGKRVTTMPRVYKYVPKKEKEKLGFRAVYYEYADKYLPEIEEAFKSGNDNNKFTLLNMLRAFIRDGADKQWIKMLPIGLAYANFITFPEVMKCILELCEKKLLVISRPIMEKNYAPMAFIGKLTFTEEEYQKASQEIISGHIEVKDYSPCEVRGMRRNDIISRIIKEKFDLMPTLDVNKIPVEEPVVQVVEEKIVENKKPELVQIAAPVKQNKDDGALSNVINTNNVNDIIDNITNTVHNLVKQSITNIVNNAETEYEDIISKTMLRSHDRENQLSDRVRALEEDAEKANEAKKKMKAKIDANDKYMEAFSSNAAEQL